MPKAGLLHDYDLMANNEPAARKTDVVCPVCDESPPKYQWSDYSGEAMCMKCGCPFQLKWGSDKQKAEGNYPYMGMKKEWVPVAREYFKETGKWTCFGTMMGPRPGLKEFFDWVDKHHPEMQDED